MKKKKMKKTHCHPPRVGFSGSAVSVWGVYFLVIPTRAHTLTTRCPRSKRASA